MVIPLPPIGSSVRPLQRLKRARSSWPRRFSGRTYVVRDHDHLNDEVMLVLATGPADCEYELVYPDEVEIVRNKQKDAPPRASISI